MFTVDWEPFPNRPKDAKELYLCFALFARLKTTMQKVGSQVSVTRELLNDCANDTAARYVLGTLVSAVDNFLVRERVQDRRLHTNATLLMNVVYEDPDDPEEYIYVTLGKIDTTLEELIADPKGAVDALYENEKGRNHD